MLVRSSFPGTATGGRSLQIVQWASLFGGPWQSSLGPARSIFVEVFWEVTLGDILGPWEYYYFLGSTGLLNKYLHTISCSQDVGVIWDFILTESHLILSAPGP